MAYALVLIGLAVLVVHTLRHRPVDRVELVALALKAAGYVWLLLGSH